ncbi:heterokaryon incompatibility protein-domain-containing protein [Xylaria sp. FL0043]|nr:heterokaryon incompatibility protein-domain-containing protein [Xylaria sp. FL0043]
MRLINTSSLKLEEFLGEPTDPRFPRYAILSHTWGKGEVTFQDMQEPEVAKKKAGYDKIAKCCETALSEGLGWAWVDTCCIDKTSSAELSEAINSMFKWYEHSTICYAYLSDVGIPESDSQAPLVYSDWRNSRWFTRGWTLQELVAPFEVIIYDREWNQLGTKRRMTSELSKKTLIPEKVLLNPGLRRENSVAARMLWAVQRQTTRIEDRAYSLLGLFDINMPLLYGEGKKALSRLQGEILNTIDDDTVFLGGLAPRGEYLWLKAYARSTVNDFLVSPGNVFDDIIATLQPTLGTGDLIRAQAFPSTNTPGSRGRNDPMRDLRLRGNILSMSMRIIQVTLPNRPPPRAYFTVNKQFLHDMDPENQRILEDPVFDRLRSDGRYPCLGMLRCGKDDQFVARYFMCKLVEQEIFAYPMPIYHFVSPKVVYHWPEMQCNIQLNRGAWEPTHFMKPLRHPASWVLPESPVWSNVTLDNGWAFTRDVMVSGDNAFVYRLFFEQHDEVWELILAQKGASSFEMSLRCSTHPEFETQTVNVEYHEHEGPVAELWRRMPVLGGSAELVVSVYCEIDSYLHHYSPMIRFRAFEPSDNEQTRAEPETI